MVRVKDLQPWRKLKEELDNGNPNSPKVAELQREAVEQSLAGLGVPGARVDVVMPKLRKPRLVPAVPGEKRDDPKPG